VPVDSTLADPTAEPNTWKATVLDPWVADVSGTIATLESGGGGGGSLTRWYDIVEYGGAIGDGAHHALSSVYGTLAAAQAVYPFVTSLTQGVNWAALRKCELAAEAAGGGVTFFPPGVYKDDTVTSGNGISWVHEIWRDDCIWYGPGAELTTDAAAATVHINGAFKAAASTAWGSNEYYDATFVAFPNALDLAKGSYTFTPTAAADTSSLAAGDWIFIKTGQTIPQIYAEGEPMAELNRVLSRNGTTGEITLQFPLAHRYRREFETAGTGSITSPSAGGTARQFGWHKVTDRTIENITWIGLTISQGQEYALICLFQFYNMVTRDCIFDHIGVSTHGFNNRRQRWYGGRTIGRYVGTDFKWWGPNGATGVVDCKIYDHTFQAMSGLYSLHCHEGAAQLEAHDCHFLNRAANGASWPSISFQGRGEDHKVLGGYILNGPSVDQAMITIGDGLSDVTIDGVEFAGSVVANQAIFCSALDRIRFGRLVMPSPLKIELSNAVAWPAAIQSGDISFLYDPPLEFSTSDLTKIGSTAGPDTVGGGSNTTGWSLPDSVDTYIVAQNRVPKHWTKVLIEVTQSAQVAGTNVAGVGAYGRSPAEGTSTEASPDLDTGVQLWTSPGQYLIDHVNYTPTGWTVAGGDFVQIQLYRNGGNAGDTLAGAVAIHSARLWRAG
jgi:hypothetical protein